MKLLCPKNDLRGQKVLVTAAFADLKVDVPEFTLGKDEKTESFKKLSPLLRVPFLETGLGTNICESNAICRYLARLRNDKGLYGETLAQNALVDMWLDFCSSDVEVPVLSLAANGEAVAARAKSDITNALRILDSQLQYRTFIVGERITVADICLCVVLSSFKQTCDANIFKPFINVVRWMDTISNQRSYKKASPKACSNPLKNQRARTTAEAKDNVPDVPPKRQCELDLLPPTTLDINEWKREYSNTKDLRGKVMPWMWSRFDPLGYCFYYMKYNKLEDECTVPYVTSNQLGGFLQRIDNTFRRYSFGVINVVGKDSVYDIQGVWMFRGLEIPEMMKEHPSFEYNTWTKLDCNNPKDKALIEDYFCNDEIVEGRPIADCKVWK